MRLLGDWLAEVPVTRDELPALGVLADAVSSLADVLASASPPDLVVEPLHRFNELVRAARFTPQLHATADGFVAIWTPSPRSSAAVLAGSVAQELTTLEVARVKRCARTACDLIFIDHSRSRTQRWHAEDPCGWIERQHRRRAIVDAPPGRGGMGDRDDRPERAPAGSKVPW